MYNDNYTCITVTYHTIVHSVVMQLIDKLVHLVLWEIVRIKSEDFSLQNITQNSLNNYICRCAI